MGVGRNSEVIRIQGPHLGEEWNTVTAAKVIIQQLETSLWLLTQSISDLSDDHWTHIPGDGLPCAAWIVGHALLVDRQVLEELEELEAPLLRACRPTGKHDFGLVQRIRTHLTTIIVTISSRISSPIAMH